MLTPTNVSEDLATLRAIARENNISPREVLWLAITRTIKRNGTRASVSSPARRGRARADPGSAPRHSLLEAKA
jgi:hypothetical protein